MLVLIIHSILNIVFQTFYSFLTEDPYDDEIFEYWRNSTAIEYIFGDSSATYNFTILPEDNVVTVHIAPNRVVFSNLDPGQLYSGSIYAVDSDITHEFEFRLRKYTVILSPYPVITCSYQY